MNLLNESAKSKFEAIVIREDHDRCTHWDLHYISSGRHLRRILGLHFSYRLMICTP
jgi:hypothetical protein